MTPRTDHFTSWLFVSAVLEDYAALWPPCALKIKLDALKSKPIFCQCQLAESIAAAALPSPWQSAIYFPAGGTLELGLRWAEKKFHECSGGSC